MAKSIIQIREYGLIAEGVRLEHDAPDFREIDSDKFYELVKFIEERSSLNEFHRAFTIFRKSGRRFIRVKNFVGVIETKTGFVVEILPKIFNFDSELSIAESKRIFLRMLKTLYQSKYIISGTAHLESLEDFPILDFFINNYIEELEFLIKGGLVSDYSNHEENLNYLRGKIVLQENIKKNIFTKHKFYCSFDEFSNDIALNRILKSTISYLILKTRSHANRKRLSSLLTHFEIVNDNINLNSDFAICEANTRKNVKFENLLHWSKIFLTGRSLTNFAGFSTSNSLLFPMEKLFENYVLTIIKRYCKGLIIKAQDRRYSLVSQKAFENDSDYTINLFNLQPDIVINDNLSIIDTKWKIIDESAKKFDISESDIYQMHAYGRRYQQTNPCKLAPRLCLIYPLNPKFNRNLLQMRFADDMYLDVLPINLAVNPELEIKRIISTIITSPTCQFLQVTEVK